MTSNVVPTYDATGAFYKAYSLASIKRQLANDQVTVVRNRKGVIVRAFMRYESGKSAVLKTAYLGTKYSYRESLRDGHWCYDLRKLGGNDPKGEDYLRPIFLTVMTSCMSTAN